MVRTGCTEEFLELAEAKKDMVEILGYTAVLFKTRGKNLLLGYTAKTIERPIVLGYPMVF